MAQTYLNVYRDLLSKARRQERYDIMPYIKYRMQDRKAIYTEILHKYAADKLSITKSTEKRAERSVTYAEFINLNGERIVLN